MMIGQLGWEKIDLTGLSNIELLYCVLYLVSQLFAKIAI